MSVRYVYDVYNTTVALRERITEFKLNTANSTYDFGEVIFCNTYKASVAENRAGTPVTKYDPVGSHAQYTDKTATATVISPDTLEYKYVICTAYASEGSDVIGQCFLLEYSPSISGAYWAVDYRRYTSPEIAIWTTDSFAGYLAGAKPFYKTGGEITRGSTLLNTSASITRLDSGAYYSGGWKWRVYKGSDTIDPLSVTYRENTLYKGEPVSVQIEARTPTYGGTISYQYQYSVDGGKTWTNAGSKTTETSLEITVPAEAKQFQARVLASDNYGFTSTTYVYGPASGVSQLKAYGGRDGKARSVLKMYSGVNGKARTVVKGYIGIGRKARKFL